VQGFTLTEPLLATHLSDSRQPASTWFRS